MNQGKVEEQLTEYLLAFEEFKEKIELQILKSEGQMMDYRDQCNLMGKRIFDLERQLEQQLKIHRNDYIQKQLNQLSRFSQVSIEAKDLQFHVMKNQESFITKEELNQILENKYKIQMQSFLDEQQKSKERFQDQITFQNKQIDDLAKQQKKHIEQRIRNIENNIIQQVYEIEQSLKGQISRTKSGFDCSLQRLEQNLIARFQLLSLSNQAMQNFTSMNQNFPNYVSRQQTEVRQQDEQINFSFRQNLGYNPVQVPEQEPFENALSQPAQGKIKIGEFIKTINQNETNQKNDE